MATRLAIPFLDLSLNRDDLQRDAKRLFAIIRPNWEWEQVKSKALSGGCSNTMVAFHSGSDDDKFDTIVLRMPGETTGIFNDYKRETEFIGIQFAIAAKCFQPVVAVFNNGIAYEYTQGRTLTRGDLDDPAMIRKVTRKLVALHSVDTNTLPLTNTKGEPITFETDKTVWSRMEHALQLIPDELADPEKNAIFQKHRVSKREMREEIKTMKSILDELNFIICPGHGDAHVKNMIFNEKTGDIFLLDYEMFGLHYEEFDIAFLLTTGPILKILGIYEPDDASDFHPDVRKHWIRSYVEAKYEYQGLKNDCIPEHVYDIADIKCTIVETLARLMQMVTSHLGLTKALTASLDPIPSFLGNKSRYFTAKDQLVGLKQRLLQLEQLS